MKHLVKAVLQAIAKNIWWIILWYIVNIAYLMHNQGRLDWTVALVAVVTAIGIIVFLDKEVLPRQKSFNNR